MLCFTFNSLTYFKEFKRGETIYYIYSDICQFVTLPFWHSKFFLASSSFCLLSKTLPLVILLDQVCSLNIFLVLLNPSMSLFYLYSRRILLLVIEVWIDTSFFFFFSRTEQCATSLASLVSGKKYEIIQIIVLQKIICCLFLDCFQVFFLYFSVVWL